MPQAFAVVVAGLPLDRVQVGLAFSQELKEPNGVVVFSRYLVQFSEHEFGRDHFMAHVANENEGLADVLLAHAFAEFDFVHCLPAENVFEGVVGLDDPRCDFSGVNSEGHFDGVGVFNSPVRVEALKLLKHRERGPAGRLARFLAAAVVQNPEGCDDSVAKDLA